MAAMTRSSNRSGRSLFLTELLWPVLTASQSNYIYMTYSNRFWSDPFISALGFTYRFHMIMNIQALNLKWIGMILIWAGPWWVVSDHVLITFCLMMVRCDSYDHLDMQPTVLVISEGTGYIGLHRKLYFNMEFQFQFLGFD